ncbi:MAG TPA: hypothetical protein VGI39_37515 [Polyangiaceae bacterium]|jgi:hypothetical protein
MSDPSVTLAEANYRPFTTDELVRLWERFRQGRSTPCPRCAPGEGPVAVAVDPIAHAYRLICVQCGAASPWFESEGGAVQVRSGNSSMPAPRASAPEE